MNTCCPPKRVPSAACFFTLCRLTVQLPQSDSIGGQRSSGQLTGKPAGAQPDYRGRWCVCKAALVKREQSAVLPTLCSGTGAESSLALPVQRDRCREQSCPACAVGQVQRTVLPCLCNGTGAESSLALPVQQDSL
ncbi:UNVERIFIED_CONTAM: hypothetical protein FKN15_007080 [Acipenser sinensis]